MRLHNCARSQIPNARLFVSHLQYLRQVTHSNREIIIGVVRQSAQQINIRVQITLCILYILISELKGEASNRGALCFAWVCTYVCMYIRRLRNAILCLRMYIRNACAIQSYACVCMSVTLAQLLCNSVAKMCPGDDYGPGLLPGRPVWPVSYGGTQPQAYQVSASLTADRLRFQ